MIHVTCDQCGKPVIDVVYVVEARDARDVLRGANRRSYLHWTCLRLYAPERES